MKPESFVSCEVFVIVLLIATLPVGSATEYGCVGTGNFPSGVNGRAISDIRYSSVLQKSAFVALLKASLDVALYVFSPCLINSPFTNHLSILFCLVRAKCVHPFSCHVANGCSAIEESPFLTAYNFSFCL